MALASSNLIYYQKAFFNAKRCLSEAIDASHHSKNHTVKLKHPITKVPEDVMAIDKAIEWCIQFHLPNWSQGTWRMHRCGYRYLLDRLQTAGKLEASEVDRLEKKMTLSTGLKKSEREKRTSAKRKKVIKPNHIEDIERYCEEKKSKWGQSLVIWLKAAVATGLRPNEWRYAEITRHEDGRLILHSKNFKYNEERSYAPFRDIDLSGFPDDVVKNIQSHLSIVKGMMSEGYIEQYVTGCSKLLYQCNKKLWPRRKANITLYTGRHQFSANAKADKDVSEEERAAMMGHKTTKTSRERYGRGAHGSRGLSPRIADASVLQSIINPARDRKSVV